LGTGGRRSARSSPGRPLPALGLRERAFQDDVDLYWFEDERVMTDRDQQQRLSEDVNM
jgi:hypothetical protein